VYSPDREARRLVPPGRAGRAFLVGGGKRLVLSGNRVLVGRSRECDLMLDDPNVSRQHAEVRREGDGWVIADLGSTNGVKVNGSRVREAALQPGDEITLGLARLSYEQE
jgi:pSer/pThr/pTyr-binding forkhead associated (FHA) protein